jgi:branched-chain amino acid transport system ATP-binding protein
MLNVNDVYVSYGDVEVLHGVTLEIRENEIIAIIGANGAGKTTLIKTIMGINHPSTGTILYGEKDLSKTPTHQIVSSGIVCVPEGRHIFPRLSVEDNLKIGAFLLANRKTRLPQIREEVYELFPKLSQRAKQLGGTLSGGEQQMLAIGRALMADPKMLLLDEPSLGMAPIIVDELFDCIRRIHQEKGIPILLVEQNAYSALEVSSRGYVLELGEVRKSACSSELLRDDDVIKAYLGG